MATRFDDELGDLSAPLLARGSSSSAGLAAATRAVVAGSGYGYGGARPGRRTSSSSARRRRRTRLLRRSLLDSGLDSVAGYSTAAETEASDPPIGFRSEYQSLRRASGHPEDDDDGDSEATDYDYGEGPAREEEEDVLRPSLAPGVVARGAAVVLATGAALAAYATALALAATVAAGASTAALTVLGVAAGACALTTPLVLRSEWRLAKMPTMRGRVNELRGEAERMRSQVNFLAMEEEDLRELAKDLEPTNQKLEQIVKGQNAGNVEDLVELVKENQDMLLEMKQNLRHLLLQDVVKLVMQSDLDRDNRLSKKEAELLETRLQYSLNIYGIVFDVEKFRRAVALSPSLMGVVTIVRRLLPDENDRVSSFWDIDTDDEEEEDDEDEEDGVYDMFYVPVEDEFRRGNSDSIRLASEYLERTGERPTLMSLSASLMKGTRGFRHSAMKSSTSSEL